MARKKINTELWKALQPLVPTVAPPRERLNTTLLGHSARHPANGGFRGAAVISRRDAFASYSAHSGIRSTRFQRPQLGPGQANFLKSVSILGGCWLSLPWNHRASRQRTDDRVR